MTGPTGDDHWEGVYASTAATNLGWYEPEPTVSRRLIEAIATTPSQAVIDVGAGVSFLVDNLLAHGFTDVTLLDISQHALTEVERRLGRRGRHVTFVHQDVVTWTPDRHYDIWHDRAVFHFLTDRSARDRYVETAAQALAVGGGLVVATFAEDGPTQCSGLPTSRYSALDLEATFSAYFSLDEHERTEHVTPGGVVQPFTWAVLRRT
jgi:2-polyprenyl-3-methyl-5-hydroxy-6-metoxy-1,4-benzoquinol methylase